MFNEEKHLGDSIIGTGKATVDTKSEDFKALQASILEHSKKQTALRDQALKTALQYLDEQAKRFPDDPDLYPLFQFIGMEKFNALMKRANGRRVLFELEYHGVHPITASFEILPQEESMPA